MTTFTSSTALDATTLNVAARVPETEAEGPGRRYALWVQGCPLRCKGCCNPHMLEDRLASLIPTQEIIDEVLATPNIEGITMIGGEPFWQAKALAEVARQLREAGLSVMVFSGMTLTYIKRQGREDWDAFLEQIDLLVDGPYIQTQHVDDRRWIGSANQKVHFLTDRYAHMAQDEQGWDKNSNTIEIRMVNGQITINGFPDESIVELSRASIKRKE
ncbi:MAG: 4Fe-4S single cluster domain-containing protein [Myxococcota bacterium]|jgi:anaerobic ribonucleoside-triphosphate reductase activating protein|nr:4Fe-4S single cluster domain-containing protein [Myxococcota bacterium]